MIFVLVLYSLLSLILLNYYQYAVNSDGISYIGIAQKYALGNWIEGTNAYWGPLFSWLLAPFLLSGFKPLSALYSAKILSLIIGFFTILGVNRLSHKFGIHDMLRIAILISIIPLILFSSLLDVTPDLLVTCIFIYYLSIIFDPEYSNYWFNGVSCGLMGALAYFSKSYALPFFVVHFVLFNLFYYFKGYKTENYFKGDETWNKGDTTEKNRKVLKNLFLGLVVFFVISGLWTATITEKYGEFTIGTAGDYNKAFIGPESQGNPINYQGLIKPPTNTAFNSWEDPSYFKMENWSPFESWYNFKYQLMLIGKNFISIINIIEYFSLLSLIIIIASMIFIFKSNVEKTLKDKLIYLLVTMLIYSGGYSFILVEIRYLWLIYILLIINGILLLKIFFKMGILDLKFRKVLLILLVFSFMVVPTIGLVQNVNAGGVDYELSKILKSEFGINGNIASNQEWEGNSHLAYFLNSTYYGVTKNTTNYQDLQDELERNNIDYYLVWDKTDNLQLSDYREITAGKINGLRIYSLKKSLN